MDTEFWYFKAGERALAEIGFTLNKEQYIHDMTQSLGTRAQAKAAGIDCAIVHNDFTKTHDFAQASYRINNLIEIKDIILEATPRIRTLTS